MQISKMKHFNVDIGDKKYMRFTYKAWFVYSHGSWEPIHDASDLEEQFQEYKTASK